MSFIFWFWKTALIKKLAVYFCIFYLKLIFRKMLIPWLPCFPWVPCLIWLPRHPISLVSLGFLWWRGFPWLSRLSLTSLAFSNFFVFLSAPGFLKGISFGFLGFPWLPWLPRPPCLLNNHFSYSRSRRYLQTMILQGPHATCPVTVSSARGPPLGLFEGQGLL